MVLAWRIYRWPNRVTSFATLTFILLLVQIGLGMVTVESGTLPVVVTSHLALATLVFASALTAAVTSMTYEPKEG
jgi:heme A synthase